MGISDPGIQCAADPVLGPRRFRIRTRGAESRPVVQAGSGPGGGAGAEMGTARPHRHRIDRPAWAGSAWYTSPQLQ